MRHVLLSIATVLLLTACSTSFKSALQSMTTSSNASSSIANPSAGSSGGNGSSGDSGASTGGSTSSNAPLASGDFVLVTPSSNAKVSGTVAISGTAGPDVANVAAYSASGQKIAADVTPVNGTYSLSFDTKQLDNGNTVISVIGFTTAAGQSGGQKLSIYLPIDIENADKPAAPVTSTPVTSGAVSAVGVSTFLSSLGICIHHAQGPSVASYVQPLKYLGVRNVRDDYADPNDFVSLHQQTGVMVNMIAKNGDIAGTLAAARTMASNGAFLSFEGPNEPNNWPITYNGQSGGGSGSWVAVAQFQSDLYKTVHADAQLQNFPIFSPTETGAETTNVGLQFLTIPQNAGALFPDGTKFSDYANVHNYVSSTQQNFYRDNQAWNAADPVLNAQWDSIFVEFGKTWLKGFAGYSNDQLQTLPRVTTETGWDSVGSPGGERTQGTVLLNTYLSQFKRGFRYTFIYMIRDGEGGDGHQGVFNSDSRPKLAATYIHNMTTILADLSANSNPGSLTYAIANQPATMHDLLLQKSNGNFELVVWNERASGQDVVSVTFASQLGSVKVFDPTTGTSAISSSQNVSSVSLTLSDHPQIIEIQK